MKFIVYIHSFSLLCGDVSHVPPDYLIISHPDNSLLMVLAMVPVSFYSYPYHMLPDNHTLVDVMVLVFGFMFTVINQEDYALLIGSIGLFIVLAIVMAVSRKIDWNRAGE